MRTIVLANQKGGVGKTTAAVNLAAGLALAGNTVLLIDMDPQANATLAVLGRNPPEVSVYQLLMKPHLEVGDAIVETKQDNLAVIPSHINLAGAGRELDGATRGQIRLREKVASLAPDAYDFLVIDAPPSLGLLTINALAAAHEIIIPVEASVFGLQGMSQLHQTIQLTRTKLDCPQLHIMGILRNRYERTNVARDMTQILTDQFGDCLFNTIIPKNIKLEEAHSRNLSIYAYAPTSTGAIAYAHLVEEVIAYGS